MFRKVYTLLVVLLIPFLIHAQGSRERAAAKDITKQRWNKAFTALQKSLSKDKQNVPAYYLLSTYYFSDRNPRFQVDSAYQNVQRAISLWNKADAKARNRWIRFPVDSLILIDLRDRIDSAAFVKAQEINTVEEYTRFIDQHPHASEKQSAIDLRYQVAFERAGEANTFDSFQSFIQTYPDAPQVPEAKKKYDELLFIYSTRDRKLESFVSFLRDNPHSPYGSIAEKNIFEILTARGKPQNFIDFLTRFPQSKFRKQATDILYHLLQEQNELVPPDFLTDSLRELSSLEKEYLVPIYVKGKFGLINSYGKVVLPPAFEEIDDTYICGHITEEVIVLPGKMINRKGEQLLNGNISGINDVGFGFLKVDVDGKTILYHKSGYPIGDFPVEDVRILNGSLLAIKNSNQWGLLTLTGRRIIPFEYENIESIGDLLVFSKNGKYSLSTIDTIASFVQGEAPVFLGPFDEFRKMDDDIWVRKDEMQGAYNQKLHEFIPLGAKTITPAFFGSLVETPEGITTYNQYGESSEFFQKVKVIEPWIAAQTSNGWVLYNADQRIYKSVPYDTLSLYGPFAVGKTATGLELNLFKKPEKLVTIREGENIEFLPGKDSVSYLMVTNGSKKTVYDSQGQLLFTVSYDKIETAGSGYFIVHKKERKGLINSSGKIILPVSYDAIGTAVNGIISVLKSKKFGAYDLQQKKLITPSYEKNIMRFDKNILIAFKGSGFGFVDNKNKPISDFAFSEIQPWSDSVALVKKDNQFQLYNFYKKNAVVNAISEINTIKDTPEEKLVIINQAGNYGVVSNTKGIIIPIKFSDIVNVGSKDKPMYFTEKHVPEASIFVVIYYDFTGKMLRKEVYEQGDYDRIYCDRK